MEKKSNFSEKSDLGYHPSPSMDHSISDNESFQYCQLWTSSEDASNSNFSDTIDDSSYASEPSPLRWTPVKPGLSKLGMKLRKHSVDYKLDDSDLLDSGWFSFLHNYFLCSTTDTSCGRCTVVCLSL